MRSWSVTAKQALNGNLSSIWDLLSAECSGQSDAKTNEPAKRNQVLQPLPQSWFVRVKVIVLLLEIHGAVRLARVLHARQLPQLPVLVVQELLIVGAHHCWVHLWWWWEIGPGGENRILKESFAKRSSPSSASTNNRSRHSDWTRNRGHGAASVGTSGNRSMRARCASSCLREALTEVPLATVSSRRARQDGGSTDWRCSHRRGHLADVSLPVRGLPSVTTSAGQPRVYGRGGGLVGSSYSLGGKLWGKLSCVENYAEHQDEERVQKVEIVVKEDSSLENWQYHLELLLFSNSNLAPYCSSRPGGETCQEPVESCWKYKQTNQQVPEYSTLVLVNNVLLLWITWMREMLSQHEELGQGLLDRPGNRADRFLQSQKD